MLELHDISYTYPQATTPVLHGLNFSVADCRLGIIGPNGCGKTTLLQLMVGLLRPDSGELLFHGTAVRSRDDLRALRREVGFLFQNSDDQLFSPTVLEDVAFGPLNLGLSPEEAARVARQTLENLGLYNFEE
ncbi:MAG: ABC transporter ATP-binding protein, partial [Desulforhopalus sp.]|nr:ABC transporter ATP-binding protein [Desulforhopalus sp.]